ncbi:hypothetical protein ACLB2K_026504 [Fragaria x ananassa]
MATYRALLSLKSSLDDPDSRLSALRLLNVFNRTFPPELSNLTNLRVLDLYNNNLTSVLPVSVGGGPVHSLPGSRKAGGLLAAVRAEEAGVALLTVVREERLGLQRRLGCSPSEDAGVRAELLFIVSPEKKSGCPEKK